MDKNRKVRKDKVIRPLTQKQVLEKIEKGESFQGVEIGDVDFRKHVIEKPVDFSEAIFVGVVNFFSAHFENEVNFQKAQFHKNAGFEGVQFQGKVDFRGTQFQSEVFFTASQFKSVVSLSAHFHDKAEFYSTKFHNRVFFDSARFDGNANLIDTQFQDEADFEYAQFKGEASFLDAQFHGDTNFYRIKFYNDVSFFNAKFYNETSFYASEFLKEANFYNTQFKGAVDFDWVQIHGEAVFLDTNFNKGASFESAQFYDLAIFIGTKFSTTQLVNVRFLRPEEVRFQGVNLTECFLLSTGISKVELTDIVWPIEKGILNRRKVVYDEIANEPEQKNYPLVEKLYRDLKKNYENRGSYGEAGDFHYGEMEMRRFSQNKFFRVVSFLWLYKVLSGYGEKHWRAIFWLGAFLVIFAGLYMLTGMESTKQGESITINYNFSLDIRYLLTSAFWGDFFKSLLHTLEVATFQRERSFASISTAGKYLEVFQTILISLQVAFTALAIKRKFRR